MGIERTLSIIKPDVVARDLIGDVYHRYENAGLRIIAAKMVHLRPEQAMRFYAQHRNKKFAVRKHREIIGDTDPKKARTGTIRSDYAHSVEENAVHGSDSVETAQEEISFFFSESEICPRTR